MGTQDAFCTDLLGSVAVAAAGAGIAVGTLATFPAESEKSPLQLQYLRSALGLVRGSNMRVIIACAQSVVNDFVPLLQAASAPEFGLVGPKYVWMTGDNLGSVDTPFSSYGVTNGIISVETLIDRKGNEPNIDQFERRWEATQPFFKSSFGYKVPLYSELYLMYDAVLLAASAVARALNDGKGNIASGSVLEAIRSPLPGLPTVSGNCNLTETGDRRFTSFSIISRWGPLSFVFLFLCCHFFSVLFIVFAFFVLFVLSVSFIFVIYLFVRSFVS